MADELKILITGSLNAEKSTKEINAAIKNIEKQISKVNLNINIDPNTIKTLQDFNTIIAKNGGNFNQLNKEIATLTKTYKDADGTIVKLTQRLYDNQEIQQTEKRMIDEQNKSLQKQIQLNKEVINQYQQKSQLKSSTIRTDSDGNFVSQTDKYTNQNDALNKFIETLNDR